MKDRIQRNYPEFHLVQEMKLLKDILRDMEDKMERSNVHLIVERREWAEQYLKKKKKYCKQNSGTSLVVQRVRIHLPMEEAYVQSLVSELRSHVIQSN